MNIDENLLNKRILWVDWAKFLAIFFILIIHCSSDFLTGGIIGSSNWLITLFFESISRWGIIVFVMVSGFLLLRKEYELKEFSEKVGKVAKYAQLAAFAAAGNVAERKLAEEASGYSQDYLMAATFGAFVGGVLPASLDTVGYSFSKTKEVLSPTPPVECLSIFIPFILDKSQTSPLCSISSVKIAISFLFIPLNKIAIAIADD